MFCSLRELIKWLGITALEVWIHVVSLLVFSILLSLKLEGVMDSTSWWAIFSPLFACDGLVTYFCIIVFIRQYKEKDYRVAGLRLLSSVVCITCIFVFKLLFCKKMSEGNGLTYSEVFASLFVLIQIYMVKACQLH